MTPHTILARMLAQAQARRTDLICYPDGRCRAASRTVVAHDGQVLRMGDRVTFWHALGAQRQASGVIVNIFPSRRQPFGVGLKVRYDLGGSPSHKELGPSEVSRD